MALYFTRKALFLQCHIKQCGIRLIVKNYKQTNTNLHHIHASRSYSSKVEKSGIGWRGVVRGMVPVGLCLIAVMQWRAFRRYSAETSAKPWQIDVYRALPLRALSRTWGWVSERRIPEVLRPTLLGLYVSMFGVNLEEAENSDLRYYPSLAEFFARALRKGIRPQDAVALTSPCDGTVLACGPITSDYVEQVKGVTYALDQFIGDPKVKTDYRAALLQDKSNSLYQCVLYLAPGDYHRFHSPCDWRPSKRRHISGELLSVSPRIAGWLPGLFSLNERAVYVGRWLYGFFSFAAVGATNVGSIHIYLDSQLRTNCKGVKCGCIDEISLPHETSISKGDALGEFRMGSTVVLIFEAPPNFRFNLFAGQKVRVGQALGIAAESYVERVLDLDTHKTIHTR